MNAINIESLMSFDVFSIEIIILLIRINIKDSRFKKKFVNRIFIGLCSINES